MRPPNAILAILMVGAIVCPVIYTGQRCSKAQGQSNSATGLLVQTTRDAQEILDLRSRTQRIGLKERPTQDVIAQVNAVLAQIGVPTQRMKSLAPEADTAVVGAGASDKTAVQYRRQSVRLTLESLSIQQVGAFLSTWNQSQEVWTPGRIELVHSRDPGTSDISKYDLTILLSALYVADNPT